MFINVALTKINDLIKREDFKSIEFIDDKNVTILFENKGCNVNESGRVTWDDDEETETTWLKDSNTKLNKPTVSNLAEAVVSVADAWNCIGRKQPTNESADVYYWVVGGEAGSEPILARFNDYKQYGGRVNYWQTMNHDDFSMTGTKWIQVQKPKAH